MAKRFIVYSTPTCTYCKRAKELLAQEGISFEERDLTDPEHPEWMDFIKFDLGLQQVPQIFEIDGVQEIRHVGGFTELKSELIGVERA